jgi:hypothetical protein
MDGSMKVISNPVHQEELQLYPDEFVNKSGDTITGDIVFPVSGYLMRDANGVRWRVTIGIDGVLTTSEITEGAIGSPWLFLFGAI